MPIIKSSSDLQRNFGAIASLAQETREPIYITRNGEASLVVMDAEAFDASQELSSEIRAHEQAVYEAYERSEHEIKAGHTTSYNEYRRQRAEASILDVVA